MQRKTVNRSRSARRRGRRSPWLLTGAFVASAALGGRLAAPVEASEVRRSSRYADAIADILGHRKTDVAPGPSWQMDLDALRAGIIAPAPHVRQGAGQVTSQQDPPKLQFDIPPGPLDGVLAAFQTITGLKAVVADEAIRTLQSPGVKGLLTPQQAIEQLLAGTGVHHAFTAADAVMLDLRAPAEFVEVTGRAAVITSPKYTEPLREIPQTIAVIPRAVIEEQGATTLSEALRNVPGITLQAGEGGGASNTAGDMFNMRGFNAANSLFVDGVRDDGLIARDVFNIEQVEVFMGPTGSDVGRSTAAGYVNMITKTPHLGATHSALFGLGTADQRRLSADFNWSFPTASSDSWLGRSAARMNVLWQDSGVPGRDRVSLESRGLAPSIALGLDTSTRVTLAAQIVRQDNLPDYGIPGAAWEEGPLAPTTVLAPAPVDQSNYYGSVDYDYDKAAQNSYTARVEHDVNRNLTLRNQTRYNQTHREAVITTIQNVAAYNPVNNLVTVARQGNERENKVVSNQTSLVDRFATGRFRHASTLGVEYTFEEQFAPTLTGLGTRAPVDIFAPNPNDPVEGFAPARTNAFSKGRTSTIALYAFDTVDLSARWQLTAGARWERFDTDFSSLDAAGVRTELAAADGLWSGKVGLLYRVNQAANIYASYGTSVVPPGAANFALSAQANNQNNPNVDPQRSTNYEVGTKWDFANGRLSLTSAVFRTDNRNVIFTVDAAAIPPIYNQDDAQRVDGVTAGVMGRITDRWDILANIGYLDAEIQSQGATNRNRLTLTPEFSGSIWSTYRLPIGLRLGGGIRYTGDVFINAANTIQSPGYHLVDGLAEYDVNSHLTLRVNIYNLTDEKYIRNVNNNGGRYNPGQPRSVMLTSNVKF